MAELTLGVWAGEYVGAGAGKGVVCKFTAACLLSASWDKCSRNDGSQKHHPSRSVASSPAPFLLCQGGATESAPDVATRDWAAESIGGLSGWI